jgi:hypothetical protein
MTAKQKILGVVALGLVGFTLFTWNLWSAYSSSATAHGRARAVGALLKDFGDRMKARDYAGIYADTSPILRRDVSQDEFVSRLKAFEQLHGATQSGSFGVFVSPETGRRDRSTEDRVEVGPGRFFRMSVKLAKWGDAQVEMELVRDPAEDRYRIARFAILTRPEALFVPPRLVGKP